MISLATADSALKDVKPENFQSLAEITTRDLPLNLKTFMGKLKSLIRLSVRQSTMPARS